MESGPAVPWSQPTACYCSLNIDKSSAAPLQSLGGPPESQCGVGGPSSEIGRGSARRVAGSLVQGSFEDPGKVRFICSSLCGGVLSAPGFGPCGASGPQGTAGCGIAGSSEPSVLILEVERLQLEVRRLQPFEEASGTSGAFRGLAREWLKADGCNRQASGT